MLFQWLFPLLASIVVHVQGYPRRSLGDVEEFLSYEEDVFQSFKHNLIRYYGVSDDFAEQFKENLKRAIREEWIIAADKISRQASIEDDEEEDDEPSTTTTQGPSPFNIVNGIYGILSGIGTLNPDRVFMSTVNFFPPSQKQTAQALINSALGEKPGTWPTPTTTIPTTTKLTTSTRDPDDDDYDEDDPTTPAPQTVTLGPAVAVAAVPVTAVGTIAPAIDKYTIRPKETATESAPVVVAPVVTSAPVATVTSAPVVVVETKV